MRKYCENLRFAYIERNRVINQALINVFNKAFSLNKRIYSKSPKKFKIIICDTEEEFKKESKYYYQKWGTATVLRNNNLITRSPEFVEKIGRWKKEDFQNLMNHEMNHVFWYSFYHSTKPCWILEGLACHIGNNFILTKKQLLKLIKKYKINSSILDYRALTRNFTKGHFPRYPAWANFIRFIAREYSTKKIIDFMNKYIKDPTKKNYKKQFKHIFKKSEQKLFNKFLDKCK